MYNIRPTTKFQKDLKRVKKRGFDISLLTDIIKKLAAGEPLPEKNRRDRRDKKRTFIADTGRL